MSRIHEALQQAERDRLAGNNAGLTTAPVVVAAPKVPPDAKPVSPDSPVAAVTTNSAPSPLEIGPENHHAKSFLDVCPKPEWSPDPKSMLFFATEGAHGSEQFRTLRSQLYRIREQQPLKKLLITSALPQEGKTFVAANLAQVIVCEPGRRALLIDADLRRSSLHQVLGAPTTPGLSDYLNGSVDERAIIQRAPLEGLFFVPGGTVATNPAELIAGSKMSTLLDRLAEYFDWIVIDCPPCIPVADAHLLAAHCDGVLMVVQADGTPPEVARKAKQQFKANSLLGVVLNRAADTNRYGSYYYGAYGVKQESAKTNG